MDCNEQAKCMAFDWAYSIVTKNAEHAHDIIDLSIGMGPEHIHDFLLYASAILSSMSIAIHTFDKNVHRKMCKTIKNPPAEVGNLGGHHKHGDVSK